MRGFLALTAALAALLGAACRDGGAPGTPDAVDVPATATPRVMTAGDVETYLAVRSKSLDRLEERLETLPLDREGMLAQVEDVGAAERRAAQALGVPWSDYAWTREEIARLLSAQRQGEDARILALELSRTRDDLKAQLAQVRDSASREFLEAQIVGINDKLERLEREQAVAEEELRLRSILEEARADLATLQGRQDRIQRRLRELLQAARARAAAKITPPAATPAN